MMILMVVDIMLIMHISLVRVTPHYTTPVCWRRLSMLSYYWSTVLSQMREMYMEKCLYSCCLWMQ